MISIVTCCHGAKLAHMPLGISDRNKMVLWPVCGGRAKVSLHTKNLRSMWFVLQRRGCCCKLSGGVALNVWFTTKGMKANSNTIIYVARASNSKRDCDAWSLLLLAAMVWSFVHMPLEISDRNNVIAWVKKPWISVASVVAGVRTGVGFLNLKHFWTLLRCQAKFLTLRHVRIHREIFYISITLRKLMNRD